MAGKSKLREGIEILVVACTLAFIVRASVAEARFIPSESMRPTLEVGDRLLIDKLTYRFRAPRRYDIVVIRTSETGDAGIPLIKRVIGLPGDHMAIHAGKVWIDGQSLTEPYEFEAPEYDEPDWNRLGCPGGVIPRGQVFLMGDNRNNSRDSHILGPMPIENIIGRTVFRFWPVPRIGLVGF